MNNKICNLPIEEEKELITFQEAQEIEKKKIEDIQLIDEEKKAIMKDALKYQVIPYFPINKEFIQKYILNNNEYPSIEGKISQAATEMKSRLGNLIHQNYDYINKLLDLELAELDMEELVKQEEELEKKVEKGEATEADLKRHRIKMAKKEMDLRFRRWNIAGAKNAAEKQFQEFLNWKETIDEYIELLRRQDPTINGPEDLNWDEIRCAEMEIKINKWKEKMLRGEELSPSQKVLIEE